MSKKKNKKFKGHHHQPQHQSVVTANVTSSIQLESTDANATAPETAIVEEAPADEITLLNKKYAYVRRDVGKLLIVLSSLAILFVAVYFIGIKTNYLTESGNWIYKLGHFSI